MTLDIGKHKSMREVKEKELQPMKEENKIKSQ
jgi:hypothetical protein